MLNKHLFITSKPMLYLVNLSEKDIIRDKVLAICLLKKVFGSEKDQIRIHRQIRIWIFPQRPTYSLTYFLKFLRYEVFNIKGSILSVIFNVNDNSRTWSGSNYLKNTNPDPKNFSKVSCLIEKNVAPLHCSIHLFIKFKLYILT